MAGDDHQRSNVSVQPQPEQPSSSDASLTPSTSLSENHETPTPPGAVVGTPVSQPENRAELIERARSFLTSPKIYHEDVLAKRKFLVEKGLSDTEIAGLLRELVNLA
jgi:hypothetical protein